MNKTLILATVAWLGISLNAGAAENDIVNPAEQESRWFQESITKDHHHIFAAVLSNQAAVISGENVPWSNINSNDSDDISLSGSGSITFERAGTYLVQYTIRLTTTPYNGTTVATAQLQQTINGVATNISQPAVTTVTLIDGITYSQPEANIQITGFALINVSSTYNNVINLAVTITGGGVTIPATSGTDANAQLTILQISK